MWFIKKKNDPLPRFSLTMAYADSQFRDQFRDHDRPQYFHGIEFSNPNFGWGTIVGMSHDLPSNCETGVSRIWPKFHVENCGAGLVSSAFNERNEDRWGGFSLHCVKENKKWQGETVTLHSITLNLIECIESGRSKLDFNQKTDHPC